MLHRHASFIHQHCSSGRPHPFCCGFLPPSLSVLPECGSLQVVSVGLQHASVVTAEVLAIGGVADGQLVVVAELEEEVDGRVAAAHHRLLVTHHPVFACRVCGRGGGGGGGEAGKEVELEMEVWCVERWRKGVKIKQKFKFV